ncbi:MAG: long-chain fatty acid--CoA ligase [Phaeodactylibacter sp.]|nr:long-chain fatty acid--CoA ligase [Phaeodactylibacter sp.]
MTNKKHPYYIRRLIDIPRYQLDNFPQEDCLAAIKGGQLARHSTQDFIERADKVSAGLLARGFKSGDKIAIISENRPEWNFLDMGMQQIGVVNVPVYSRVSREEYQYIFNNAGVKAVFVSSREIYEKVALVRDGSDTVEEVFSFDELENAPHWSEILEEPNKAQLDEIREEIEESALATIVYTSGTTGPPKGVMLTHHNIVSNVKACLPIMPVGREHLALSFLPLNHVFERMMNYLYLSAGVSVYYAESVDTIGDNLRLARPHIFTTVPRLLEKVYEKIVDKGEEQPLPARLIFGWSLNLAKRFELRGKSFLYHWQRKLADALVFGKWRKALGGRVIAVVSGGAALNPKIARVFTAAGVPALEGYGLTETSPVIAVNRMEKKDRKFGSVGKIIDGVEVKIAEDGEILCRGPNVMKGYFEKPEKTEEALEEDGWLHTGDIGELDEEGFLSITDRKKSMFKTSGGKYVAPQRVENTFTESSFIENILTVGDGRKMVTAIIQPNFERLKKWCEKEGLNCGSKEEIIKNESVRTRFEKITEERNEELSHTEQVKKFRLTADEWGVESGELTPTMKIKRGPLQEKYAGLIEEMYTED